MSWVANKIIKFKKTKLTVRRHRTDLIAGLVRLGLFAGGGALEADVSSFKVHNAALSAGQVVIGG